MGVLTHIFHPHQHHTLHFHRESPTGTFASLARATFNTLLPPTRPTTAPAEVEDNTPPPSISLPIELGRYIFELAALHDPRTASMLLLVSRQVKEWITPLLYSVFVFDDHRTVTRMRNALDKRGPDWLSQNVKAVGIKITEVEQTSEFLLTCTSINHLACWSDSERQLSLVGPSILHLQPRTLTMALAPFFGTPDFRSHFFEEITHLHILDVAIYWKRWSTLPLMPNLTHLAFQPYFLYARRLRRHQTHTAEMSQARATRLARWGLGSMVHGHWTRTSCLIHGWSSFRRRILVDDWRDFVAGGTSNIWAYAERITALRRRITHLTSLPQATSKRRTVVPSASPAKR